MTLPTPQDMLGRPDIEPGLKAKLKSVIAEKRKDYSRILRSASIGELQELCILPAGISMNDAKHMIDEKHDELVDQLQNLLESDMGKSFEERWFKKMMFYLPPMELRQRHPGMQEAVLSFRSVFRYDQSKLDKVSCVIFPIVETEYISHN